MSNDAAELVPPSVPRDHEDDHLYREEAADYDEGEGWG